MWGKINNLIKNNKQHLAALLVIAMVAAISVYLFKINNQFEEQIKYSDFVSRLNKGEVDTVIVDLNASTFKFIDHKKKIFLTDNPRTANFKEFLLENEVTVADTTDKQGGSNAVFLVIVMGLLIAVFALARTKGLQVPEGGGSKGPANLESESTSKSKLTFDDIAGNSTIKKDVQFIIDFLKQPERYKEIGARMPKGIIFYGPPGTGKTLCAKAIAGEASVPFYQASGSDFMEMYVGVGAKRVRELFGKARKKAPCIVFIDELDAVGKKRGTDNHTEKDQTINALLTELDGFASTEGIVVIGATNRLDILDDALIRPGRFDKHLAIPLPDLKERMEILELYAIGKKLSPEVNLERIAKITIGFSGAALETLLNESAIIAVNKGKLKIETEDIDDAYYKIIMKGDKRNVSDLSAHQVKLVAWHEAGHALTAKSLAGKRVQKITIVPSTSGAGGATFIIPENVGLQTKKDLMNEVKIMYSGRIAELLLTEDEELITTGASQDIRQATECIMRMIKEFGMTEEFGMLYMGDESNQPEVMQEAKFLSKKLYEETYEYLNDNKKVLEQIALKLIEKETMEEEDLDQLLHII